MVKEVKPNSVVIQHDSISNYMDAMTMPFKVRDTNQLAGLHRGDKISFRLLVKEDESWIDHISKTRNATNRAPEFPLSPGGKGKSANERPNASEFQPNVSKPAIGAHPLMNYNFTNEFGQPVALASFRGQALGITFFFTRCPIPEYCPRLSRNFEEASNKLLAMPNAPTNWHFLSVSIDPQMDTPGVLRAYARRYHSNSNHWSFLTGPVEKVRELAEQSGVTYEPDNGLFNHNFRTLVIDTGGHMQTSFPIGGNLSDALVTEILKAIAPTNTVRPEASEASPQRARGSD
jgi:protein SCO1/2